VLDVFGLYRPRHTPLHALPAWIKVIGLAGAAVGLVVMHGPFATAIWLVASIAVLASTLPPLHPTLRGLFPVAILSLVMGGYQWFRGDPTVAAEIAADFISISCCALALTTSTALDEAMGLVSKAARPIRKIIPQEAVGLVFALTVRAIPQITMILKDSADAARARGLGRSPRAMFVPATVRTFGWALAVGEAITARGLADPADYEAERGATTTVLAG
jgi:biotin transport system permease protein